MEYVQLGLRGPRVSRIAFGNWSSGGDWGSVDRKAAIAAARSALDREGKVRHLGVSNYDARQMAAFQQSRPLDALQPPYHLFRREIEDSVLPYTAEHGIGVLVYGPMAHGLLSGRMTEDIAFAPGDWRANSDLFRGDTFRRNLRIVEELKAFAAERGTTVARLAIAWTLANPAVHVAIVGGRTPDQISATLPAAEVRLSPDDLAHIEKITRGEVPVGGPVPESV